MLLEGFDAFGFQVQYWMLLAALFLIISIVVIVRE